MATRTACNGVRQRQRPIIPTSLHALDALHVQQLCNPRLPLVARPPKELRRSAPAELERARPGLGLAEGREEPSKFNHKLKPTLDPGSKSCHDCISKHPHCTCHARNFLGDQQILTAINWMRSQQDVEPADHVLLSPLPDFSPGLTAVTSKKGTRKLVGKSSVVTMLRYREQAPLAPLQHATAPLTETGSGEFSPSGQQGSGKTSLHAWSNRHRMASQKYFHKLSNQLWQHYLRL